MLKIFLSVPNFSCALTLKAVKSKPQGLCRALGNYWASEWGCTDYIYSHSVPSILASRSIHLLCLTPPHSVSTAHLSRWHTPGSWPCSLGWATASPRGRVPVTHFWLSSRVCSVSSASALSLPFQYWLTQPDFLSYSRCPCYLYYFWFFSHFTGISQWKSVSFKLFLFNCFSKVGD